VERSTVCQPVGWHDHGAPTGRKGMQEYPAMEKKEMLRHKCFPVNNDDQYCKLRAAGSAHPYITKQAVEPALYSQSVTKAPSPGKLSIGGIQVLWKCDNERIVRLMKIAVCMGRHPAVRKSACIVVIRKHAKDNYTKLDAYHSRVIRSYRGKWSKLYSQSFGQKNSKEEGNKVMDCSGEGRNGHAIFQQPS